MKRLCFFILFITVFSTALSALEWPADVPIFIRSFGQRIHGQSLEQGLVFENPSVVRTAENGMLIVELTKSQRIGSFPSTLGNAMIFMHRDGLQTVYGNLDSTALFHGRINAEIGTVIGKTGKSGWAPAQTLLFQVSDTRKNVYINPLLLLPTINDKHPPKIQNIFLINEKNTIIQISGQKNMQQGFYELYAEIYDTADDAEYVLAPFRATILLNGTIIRTISFETITQKNNAFYLGDTSFNGTFLYRRQDALYLGKIELNRGKSEILITVRDITGNEKSELFVLYAE